MITSVLDIKTLIVKLVGFYENKLKFFSYISFFFSRIYNKFYKNENNNFFPLLTNLVQKIYNNFGFEKDKEECNRIIIKYLKIYFKVDIINNILKEGDERNSCIEEFRNDFDKDKFIKDYLLLSNLFWNSDLNFRIEETIEEDLLNRNNENVIEAEENEEKKFLSNNYINNNEVETIVDYIRSDLGLNNRIINLNYKQKMIIKIFYVSYICNEIINSICGNINQKGFKYKSICDFYYNVSISYNDAIIGFEKIKEDLNEEKNRMVNYASLKKEGIGNPPETIIFGSKKKGITTFPIYYLF